jgi:hypothetical protein
MLKKEVKEKRIPKYVVLWFVVTYFSAGDDAFGQADYAQYRDLKSFRGIEWGQHISTIPQEELQFQLQDDTIKYYTRKGDKLEMGSVSLETIHYGFWKDKFMEARIYVLDSLKETLKELESVFGDDYEEEDKDIKWFYCQHSYIWEKVRTRIILVGPPTRWDKEAATCMVTIISNKILAEKKAYERSDHVIQKTRKYF